MEYNEVMNGSNNSTATQMSKVHYHRFSFQESGIIFGGRFNESVLYRSSLLFSENFSSKCMIGIAIGLKFLTIVAIYEIEAVKVNAYKCLLRSC